MGSTLSEALKVQNHSLIRVILDFPFLLHFLEALEGREESFLHR